MDPARPGADAGLSSTYHPLSRALADRYRIERALGEGGMATVFLAHDVKHDRRVALKVLKPELAAVLGAERFVVEIKTTAALQHPHILPLFDSGSADGFLYYVMPYIEGETIREKLNRETQFGVDESVRIAREVADALDYAHRKGVVHRDIKPENILLHDGRAMVMDFGIALAVSAAAGGRMTETGLSLGTPHYMSPEQATAEKEVSGRSDIYSLASVLYEMLAGEPPHGGGSAQQIIMKIITETPAPVTARRKSVPPNIAAAVATALEKLPADRFSSAKEFAAALQNPAYSNDSLSIAIGAAPRDWRAKVAVPAIALAALLLAVVAWSALRPAAPQPVTRREVVWRGPDGPESANLIVSPDASRLVTVQRDSSNRKLHVRRRDQLEAIALAGTEGAFNPAISPQGDRIAFMTPGSIRVVGIDGGPVSTVTDSMVGVPGLAWGSDGYIYYDGRGVGPLLRVRESGGNPEIVSTLDTVTAELQHVWPDVLPNGRGVIMTINRGGPGMGAFETDGIAVLDLRTGRHRELFRGIFARYAASGHLLYVTREGDLMAVPFDQDRLEVTGRGIAIEKGLSVQTGGSGGVNLTISRGGELWYVAGGQGVVRQELVWATRDGRTQAVEPEISGNIADAALSPDGTRIAFILRGEAGGTVWVTRIGSQSRDRLTFERTFQTLAWSPDSRSLLVNETRGEVRTVPADASGLATSVRGIRDVSDVRWSPDGKWIAWSATQGTSNHIFGLRPGLDTVATPLITTANSQRTPAISPDGRWIVFQSARSGLGELYVRPFPNTDGSLRQVSGSFGRQPRWSKDGRELFYRTYNDSLYVVPILPGTTFTPGPPRALFQVSGVSTWDVSPDAKRFLLVRARAASVSTQLIVVENFFEELRRRLPP